MKKIIPAALLALIVLSHAAAAQQYVYPIYTQNSQSEVQPYAPPAQPAAAQPAMPAQRAMPTLSDSHGQNAPSANAIPLSGQEAAAAYSNTGYGTAIYSNGTGKPSPAPTPGYAAAPVYTGPGYSAPSQTSYATYASVPRPIMPIYNWTGCYLGGYLGGAFGGNANASPLVSQGGTYAPGTPYNATSLPNSYDTGSGFMGGGTLGCNYQFMAHTGSVTGIVLGLEGEGGTFNLTGSGVDPNSNGVDSDTHQKTQIGNWDAIFAGRIGAAFDRTFIYGKFGAVFSEANSRVTDNCTTGTCGLGTINASGQQDIIDAAIGGGVEYALNDNWSVKGEYMYLDTSDNYQVCGAGGGQASGSTFCSQHELNGTHTFKVGLNYHFSGIDFGDRYVTQR